MTPLISLIFLFLSINIWAAPTFKQVNSSIPSELRTRLKTHLGLKREMDVVTATKEGHWILIGRGVRAFSNRKFFDRMKGNGSMPLRQKVNEYITNGRRINALGITQDNN